MSQEEPLYAVCRGCGEVMYLVHLGVGQEEQLFAFCNKCGDVLRFTHIDEYKALDHITFGTMVTGELTHYAIWLEDALNEIITNYFSRPSRKVQFTQLLLHREGMTFQSKIDILRSMVVREFKNTAAAQELKLLLNKVEAFKRMRNAFAHGHDVTPKSMVNDPCIHIEILRSGKGKVVEVTPESHFKTMRETEQLFQSINAVAKKLRAENTRSANSKVKTN